MSVSAFPVMGSLRVETPEVNRKLSEAKGGSRNLIVLE